MTTPGWSPWSGVVPLRLRPGKPITDSGGAPAVRHRVAQEGQARMNAPLAVARDVR